MKIDNDSFVLGVDVDDVLAHYGKSLGRLVEIDRGMALGTLPPANTWSFDNWKLESGEWLKYHTQLIKSGGFATMEPLAGASAALRRLSEAGVYIRIVTHRLVIPKHHAIVVSDTVSWLDSQEIPYRDICFAANKATVGADLYVDDAPHNYQAIKDAGMDCILFNQCYNAHLDAPLRAHNWEDVESMVMSYVSSWSGR